MRAYFVLTLLAASFICRAETVRILDEKMHHLGVEGLPEWAEFENHKPEGRRLDFTFQSDENAEPCSLFIRQDNVKFPWTVRLNGKKLGELLPMDALQVNAFAIPAKMLLKGENTLAIVPPAASDDILVGEFRLDSRPRNAALSSAKLRVKVTDAQSKSGLPCRITLASNDGALMPMRVLDEHANDPSRLIASRTGVVYTRDGLATLGVLPGSYTLYATRGFEYSMPTKQVSVQQDQTLDVDLQIEREVPTPGLVACDTHIHTQTNHGDATLDERMLTIAGEGIELAISTEHNHHADFFAPQTRTALLHEFTSVLGNEITTKVGHFNAFPIRPGSTPPDDKIEEWPKLMKAMRATPNVVVVTLNHPRDVHANFTPFGPANFNPLTGEHVRADGFEFNAIEVVTSAALQSDIELLYRDWFALLNRGIRISGIASSDSHDVSRFILGQARTYVACDDSKPGMIDVFRACDSFLLGRVYVSMGLLADLRVENRFGPGDLVDNLPDQINVTATVLGPSWVAADRIQLFANGEMIRDEKIAPTKAIQKARIAWTIPRPTQDVHLILIATGPGVSAPCWAIPRPYQPSSKSWTPRVIGSTNPIILDTDGDKKFTSPREVALKLWEQSAHDVVKVIDLLEKYDRPTAIHSADIAHAAKIDLKADTIQSRLNKAPDHIRRAFSEFQQSSRFQN